MHLDLECMIIIIRLIKVCTSHLHRNVASTKSGSANPVSKSRAAHQRFKSSSQRGRCVTSRVHDKGKPLFHPSIISLEVFEKWNSYTGTDLKSAEKERMNVSKTGLPGLHFVGSLATQVHVCPCPLRPFFS